MTPKLHPFKQTLSVKHLQCCDGSVVHYYYYCHYNYHYYYHDYYPPTPTKAVKLSPTEVGCSAAVSTCAKGLQWLPAFLLLSHSSGL